MVTKGVASVPSPVRNLREWSKEIEHEKFVEVVAREFADKYGLSGEVKVRIRVLCAWLGELMRFGYAAGRRRRSKRERVCPGRRGGT